MNELQIIKEYFPKSANKIISSLKNTINESNNNKNIIAENDNELQDYIIKNTQNLNINVKLVKEAIPNAFTIYGTIDKNFDPESPLYNTLMRLPIIGNAYSISFIYLKLLKANIDAYVDSNNKIIFTHKLPSDFILTTYQTTGLQRVLKNDVTGKFAILLHEIGHWHNYNQYLLVDLVTILSRITAISTIVVIEGRVLNIILMIILVEILIINYIRSINEANCDKFVNKLGYGNHISRSLFKMLYPKANYDDKKDEIKKLSTTFLFKIKDFMHRIFVGYPHTDNRIGTNINEGILDLMFEIEFKDIFDKFDEFFNKIL